MKRSSEIIGSPVISISEGLQIGTIKGMVINPQQKKVEFLLLDDYLDDVELKGLSLLSAEGVGEFAVTVQNSNELVNLSKISILLELVQKDILLLGTKVVTKKGRLLGEVVEFSVYTENGELAEVYYNDAEENEVPLSADSIITIGKEVLIVEEDDIFDARPAAQPAAPPPPPPPPPPAQRSAAPAQQQQTQRPAAPAQQQAQRPAATPAQQPAAAPAPKAAAPQAAPAPAAQPTTKGKTGNFKKGNDRSSGSAETTIDKSEKAKIADQAVAEKDMLISEPKSDLDPAEIFVRRQQQFLIGKTLLKDLKMDDGEIIAWENEIITEELFERVYKLGTQKLMELAMSVRE